MQCFNLIYMDMHYNKNNINIVEILNIQKIQCNT